MPIRYIIKICVLKIIIMIFNQKELSMLNKNRNPDEAIISNIFVPNKCFLS